jgi:hypothetical protein
MNALLMNYLNWYQTIISLKYLPASRGNMKATAQALFCFFILLTAAC